MSWSLQPVDCLKLELVLTDEPNYIHALEMAPHSRESKLDSGTWLIVVFPVWSGPVRESVRSALACAKENGGVFHLGIRPFNSHEELDKWWPVREAPSAGKVLVAVQDEGAHREIHISTDPSRYPIWLVLQDGHCFHQGEGPRSKEQLNLLMRAALE